MRCLPGIVLGSGLGAIATAAAGLTCGGLAEVSQAEAAFAMGVVFLAGPIGGVPGAVVGGLLGARWARRACAD